MPENNNSNDGRGRPDPSIPGSTIVDDPSQGFRPGVPEFSSVVVPVPSNAFPANLLSNTAPDMPFCHINMVDPVAYAPRSRYAVGLPMPASMRVAYDSRWEEVDLGFLGGAGYNAYDVLYNRPGLSGQTARNTMTSLGQHAVVNTLNAVGTQLGSAYQKANRFMLNNHAALLFKGMAMREFQLQFQIFPKSAQDSEQIKMIIFQLKYAMHPKTSDSSGEAMLSAYFEYPHNFILGFYGPGLKWLFRTSPCALTHLEVEYHAFGVPAYFDETNDPAGLTLTLHFKEAEIITKKRIQQGW